MANDYHPFEQRRITLHEELVNLLGTSHVYYQPPENITMEYPAIVYERYNLNQKYSGNSVYNVRAEYHVTVIDSDPDSIIVDKMSKFRTSKFLRHYKSNGLNHDVFKIFY